MHSRKRETEMNNGINLCRELPVNHLLNDTMHQSLDDKFHLAEFEFQENRENKRKKKNVKYLQLSTDRMPFRPMIQCVLTIILVGFFVLSTRNRFGSIQAQNINLQVVSTRGSFRERFWSCCAHLRLDTDPGAHSEFSLWLSRPFGLFGFFARAADRFAPRDVDWQLNEAKEAIRSGSALRVGKRNELSKCVIHAVGIQFIDANQRPGNTCGRELCPCVCVCRTGTRAASV